MSSTVEVTPARRHSRARFLVLIPLLPALAALAMVATVPMSAVTTDQAAQSLPATVAQPAAAPVQATPAITASPSPSAAAVQIFSAPPITVLPPPPPPVVKRSGGRSSGHTVTEGRCSVGGVTDTSVSSDPYSGYEQSNFALLNDDRAAEGLPALAWSGGLANSARAWATYLADNDCVGSEIGHSKLWRNGENVYWISGGGGDGLAARANNAFMNSTGHRANLLRPTFQSVGIGIAHGAGGWYVVQNFSN